jgi:hypothetical protein
MRIEEWEIEMTPDGSEVVSVRNDAADFRSRAWNGAAWPI